MIKTLYSSSLLLFTLYILHRVNIFVFFHSPEQLTFLARTVSPPTVFDLDGLNKHHFIGN